MSAVSDVMSRRHPSTRPATSLDVLPVEILMEIASSLDCRSLLSLEHVSERCRDAVALHFGRKSYFYIGDYGEKYTEDPEWGLLNHAQKVALLSRLTGLREVFVSRTGVTQWLLEPSVSQWLLEPSVSQWLLEPSVSQWLLETSVSQWLLEPMVAASTGWSRLEKLTLYWRRYELDPTLLGQLCANCPRLTDVTLHGATQQALEAVLTARHGELRRLEVGGSDVKLFGRLTDALAGCVRLESLSVRGMRSVLDRLPADGLPPLRHLSLSDCNLRDSVLACVLERQPGLETVCLEHCGDWLTQNGLALLGRLPALSSLTLRVRTLPRVSDWLLEQLSAAPLTELTLVGVSGFTAEGLLGLTRSCPALKWVTLWDTKEPKRPIDCRSDAGKQELIWMFEERRTCHIHCRLSGSPADNPWDSKARSRSYIPTCGKSRRTPLGALSHNIRFELR